MNRTISLNQWEIDFLIVEIMCELDRIRKYKKQTGKRNDLYKKMLRMLKRKLEHYERLYK